MIKHHVPSWEQREGQDPRVCSVLKHYGRYYQWQFHFDILAFKDTIKALMAYSWNLKLPLLCKVIERFAHKTATVYKAFRDVIL